MKSLSLQKPHVIALVGLPGSGKSTFALKFAETFRAPCTSLSQLLELTEGNDDVARNVMGYQIDELLRTGQTIVVDGGTDTRTERTELATKARRAGYETMFIWIQIDEPSAKLRSTATNKKQPTAPLDQDEFDHRVRRFTAPNASEKPAVISGKHTYASQARVVLSKLAAPRAEAANGSVKPPVRNDSAQTPPTTPPGGRHNITIG